MLPSFSVSEAATFVMNQHLSAWQCKSSLGFQLCPWPEVMQSHFNLTSQLVFCEVISFWRNLACALSASPVSEQGLGTANGAGKVQQHRAAVCWS